VFCPECYACVHRVTATSSVAKWAVVGLAMLRLVAHALANAAVVPVWVATPPCRASAGLWGGECWCFFLVDVCCWLQRRNLVHESVSRFTDVWVCVCAAVWTHRASIAQ
jgi:hypothetical protein